MSTNLSNYDINIYRGNTFKLDFKYTDNLNRGIDLSGYTARMQVRRSRYDDKLVAELNENYPNGSFGRGVEEDFTAGNGVLGFTGGIILNYQGVTGQIHIEIDTETTWSMPVGKNAYGLELVENSTGIQRTILRGSFDLLPNTTRYPRSAPEFTGEPGLTVEYGTGYDQPDDEDPPGDSDFSGENAWGTDTLNGNPESSVQQGQYLYINSDVANSDGISYEFYIDYSVDEGELVFFEDLIYEITHYNYNAYPEYNESTPGGIEQTDRYVWRVGSTIPIETGEFLDGTPWVVDNGDLYLLSVTPQEFTISTDQGTGIVGRTVINPDFGKMLITEDELRGVTFPWNSLCKNRVHVSQADESPVLYSDPDQACNSPNSGCGGWCPMKHPFDFRAGVLSDVNYIDGITLNVGIAYDSSQAWSGAGVRIETGDMVITQTPFTGDFKPLFDGDPGSSHADTPWTESYGCFTVVASTPSENSFRPPVNWDIRDKQNRPILTEGNTFSDDLFTYPSYTLSSDDPVDWGTSLVAFRERFLKRLGTISPAMHSNRTSSVRGSLKTQMCTDREYGGYQAIDEEKMMICCFDSNISEENRTKFRRTVAQRGIDSYGAVRSLGKNVQGSGGGHHNEYAARMYFAWAVTGNSDIYDCLDGIIGNTANGTYKVFDTSIQEDGLGDENIYDENHQSHIGPDVCSFRHFDLPITELDLTPGRQGIKVERPIPINFYYDNPSLGNAPIYLARFTADPAGRSWGWSDNKNIVGKQIVSGYIRTKSNSNPNEITRIVDVEIELGDAVDIEEETPGQNPQFVTFYLQEDILDGTETHIDLCSFLEETKSNLLTRTITRAFANTASESGVYAYTYSVIRAALSNHLIGKSMGGRDSLPHFGKVAWDKSRLFFTTNAGKELLLSNINSAYNLRSDLYHALCRQEIADGLLLNPSPTELGDKYLAENYYPLPETKTWVDIEYPPGDIRYWSSIIASVNSGREFWNYSDNTLAFFPQRSYGFYDLTNGYTFHLRSNESHETPIRWGDIVNLDLYCWVSGSTRPIRIILSQTDAESNDDLTWNSYYIIQDSTRFRNSTAEGKIPLVFFVDNTGGSS